MRRPTLFLKYNTYIFMTEQELREIFQLLEAQGLRPQLCDTPVPYYEEAAPCVIPSEMGDTVEGEYFLLPRDLVCGGTTMIIHASADSLRKADPIYQRPTYQWTAEMAPTVRISILDRRAGLAKQLRRLLDRE